MSYLILMAKHANIINFIDKMVIFMSTHPKSNINVIFLFLLIIKYNQIFITFTSGTVGNVTVTAFWLTFTTLVVFTNSQMWINHFLYLLLLIFLFFALLLDSETKRRYHLFLSISFRFFFLFLKFLNLDPNSVLNFTWTNKIFFLIRKSSISPDCWWTDPLLLFISLLYFC